jgi:hypothetical protein
MASVRRLAGRGIFVRRFKTIAGEVATAAIVSFFVAPLLFMLACGLIGDVSFHPDILLFLGLLGATVGATVGVFGALLRAGRLPSGEEGQPAERPPEHT